MAGQYAGNFLPEEAGAYEVGYKLKFPDGEEIEQSGFVRVGELIESKDTSFAVGIEDACQYNGGKYLHIPILMLIGSLGLRKICLL